MKVLIVAPPFVEGAIEEFLFNHVCDVLKGLGVEYVYAGGYEETRRGTGFYNNDNWMLATAHAMNEALHHFRENIGITHVIFTDFWTPGMEMLGIHRALNGLDFKIAAWIHGASFVEGDLVSEYIKDHFYLMACEDVWLKTADELWAGSQFFARDVPEQYRDKLRITTQPFDPEPYVIRGFVDKCIDVVLPCRFAPDKIDVEVLSRIATDLPELSFVITAKKPEHGFKLPPNISFEWRASEEEHINVLKQSKVVLSMAKQEGWGYGILKAIACGCYPVLPNQAVYPELYPRQFLYDSYEEMKNGIELGTSSLMIASHHGLLKKYTMKPAICNFLGIVMQSEDDNG